VVLKTASMVLLCVLSGASAVLAQSTTAPSFDVASIKQIEYTDQVRNEVLAGTRRPRTTVTDTAVSITYTSLLEIVRQAFRILEPWRLSAPEWLNELRFDIQATIPAGARRDQVPEMLQSLLSQRFGLVSHRESRVISGHALVRGKDTKLREMTAGELEDLARERDSAKFEAQTIRTETTALTFKPTPDGLIQVDIKGMSMSELARELASAVGDPVVDRTALPGRYQFTLEVPMMGLAQLTGRGVGAGGGGPATGASEPQGMSSMVEAIQRLGLRLESDRLPVEVIVIDKMSRTPTPD
jgi:uncharacterized protein (TIGR03435 family)